ncbi:DUF2993 domain-containing protein [Corynebacterium hansenii]|uniref:DUF2993 domain-containing protein n=1 Tax=Corynebacterium hansenii TaxID=394964 RepID=A0ABV7ZP50_9CORY|nr:DUF2993 domain-containing protein [Corynebacterium hansenii]WJZ00928.1 hypothetical protein CHAN_11710 [Corynebacterium hansenii]
MSISRPVKRISAAVGAVALLAVGADFGLAIHAERNLANRIRQEMNLPADPYVSLGGAAYASSFFTGKWSSIQVRARDLEIEGFGLVSVESGAVDVEVPKSSVWTGDFADGFTKRYHTKLQLDGLSLGRQFGFTDLAIQNLEDVSPAGGWETEAIFKATPKGWSAPAEVAVKLRIVRGDAHFTPIEVISGPEGPDSDKVVKGRELSDDAKAAIMPAFELELTGAELPLRQRPTRIFVSGGSIFIEGDELYRTVSPEDFLPVATPDPELGGETDRGGRPSQ